jgi:H+/Cl- antiporter ClcA
MLRIAKALLRRRGAASVLWRRRTAVLGGAVAVGIAAVVFAHLADAANAWFMRHIASSRWLPLAITPIGYSAIVWITLKVAPAAAGSGIPQIIAAKRHPEGAVNNLASARVALVKAVLTVAALGCGASVGREGPTVQVGASVMALAHRLMRVRIHASALIAGAAAGVAAAFNTPLAGITFAIEELAVAYEQQMTLLVMGAVIIAGMTSLGIAGDYVYFGLVGQTLSLGSTLVIAPIAGIAGGIAGAMFSRAMLWLSRGGADKLSRGRPVLFAAACGLIASAIGVATQLTWGTGYAAARGLIVSSAAPWWFAPAKFVATLTAAAAGLPGGIFAPTLATGAGLGNLLHNLFPAEPTGAVVLLGMAAYFTGVVRAPLTSVIVISETTGSRGLMLPLLAASLVAEFAASVLSKERLYHGLAEAHVSRAGDVEGLPKP